MKLLKLSASLLVTASAFVPFGSPAQAGPFSNSTGLFSKSSVSTPSANPTASPTSPESNNRPGSEVAPLGTHESWLKPQIFTKNPKALCDTEETGLGSDTASSTDKTGRTASNSNTYNRGSSVKDGGGGGVNVLGVFSANGSGRAQSSSNESGSSKTQSSLNQERTRASSTVRVGHKVSCGSVLEWSAKRDMNYEDNLTQRYGIKLNRNGQQVDSLLTVPRR